MPPASPSTAADRPADVRTIAVATGSRAEFGLLRPVLAAMQDEPALSVRLAVAGAHLLPPARTVDEVRAAFPVATEIPMQEAGRTGRAADAAALGRGVAGFAAWLAETTPDWMLVLGDRIEAFAAASAAAVGGVRVAHIHGGDRAAGVADEGMRHAITKLAHLHFAASARSAERILCLGEAAGRIRLVGSPAVDDLAAMPPLDDDRWAALGAPDLVVLLHPTGEPDAVEEAQADTLLGACLRAGRVVVLDPNHDPGRDGIMRAIERHASDPGLTRAGHLDRAAFIGLLRRARGLVGNSSAGRIECAAIPVPVADIGPRQAGRECPRNVVHVPTWDERAVAEAIVRVLHQPVPPFRQPFGDGSAGTRIARILADLDPGRLPLAKRNTF